MKHFAYTITFLSLLLATTHGAMAQDDFQLRITSLGMEDVKNDMSDSTDIVLPIPTCAYANITGLAALPKKKTSNFHGWLEIYDGNGNYFKKRIIISAQGRSAVSYAKKNFKIDFCEDEWEGEETTDVTFGDWVTQDGFHLKAFSFDWFKGTGIQAYRTYDLMTRDRGEYGRIWERANLSKPDVNALCHPDAFGGHALAAVVEVLEFLGAAERFRKILFHKELQPPQRVVQPACRVQARAEQEAGVIAGEGCIRQSAHAKERGQARVDGKRGLSEAFLYKDPVLIP